MSRRRYAPAPTLLAPVQLGEAAMGVPKRRHARRVVRKTSRISWTTQTWNDERWLYAKHVHFDGGMEPQLYNCLYLIFTHTEIYIYIYSWIFQVCKIWAFSPKKPTKRRTFYISRRSSYIYICTCVCVCVSWVLPQHGFQLSRVQNYFRNPTPRLDMWLELCTIIASISSTATCYSQTIKLMKYQYLQLWRNTQLSSRIALPSLARLGKPLVMT